MLLGRDKLPSECLSNAIPIRDATLAYLTRPVEKDFSYEGVIIYVMTCCVYIFTLCKSFSPPLSLPFSVSLLLHLSLSPSLISYKRTLAAHIRQAREQAREFAGVQEK